MKGSSHNRAGANLLLQRGMGLRSADWVRMTHSEKTSVAKVAGQQPERILHQILVACLRRREDELLSSHKRTNLVSDHLVQERIEAICKKKHSEWRKEKTISRMHNAHCNALQRCEKGVFGNFRRAAHFGGGIFWAILTPLLPPGCSTCATLHPMGCFYSAEVFSLVTNKNNRAFKASHNKSSIWISQMQDVYTIDNGL